MTMPMTNNRARGLVAVRADARNSQEILEELQKTFAEFKKEHEEQLADLKKNKVDPLQAEKVEKINTDISMLQKALDETNAALAAARIGGSTGAPLSQEVLDHQNSFDQFFRRGVEADLADLEVKASLTTQSDPDGGYLVPEEMESTIDRVLTKVSIFRQLARVINISSSTYKRLVSMGGASSGWVGEEDEREETTTPTLREIVINTHELYAEPAATQNMLDDARLDIGAWLGDEVSTEFSEQEGAAFIVGDGNKKPRGILAYDTVENSSYGWGKVGFINSGHVSGFAEADPVDAIIDLYYALKAGHRNNARFLTSDAVMGTIRKFKDGDGNYIWAPPTGADMPGTILGKPVETDDNMPALGANAFPLAFGDFQKAYTIIDRFGVRLLRDALTKKPFVKFYTTKRVGGGLTNFEAVKLLKCATG